MPVSCLRGFGKMALVGNPAAKATWVREAAELIISRRRSTFQWVLRNHQTRYLVGMIESLIDSRGVKSQYE